MSLAVLWLVTDAADGRDPPQSQLALKITNVPSSGGFNSVRVSGRHFVRHGDKVIF